MYLSYICMDMYVLNMYNERSPFVICLFSNQRSRLLSNVCILISTINIYVIYMQCEIAARHGYQCEGHVVITEDGYMLTMHRLPCQRIGCEHLGRRGSGQPVFLQHGLLSSSADWLLSGPNKALGEYIYKSKHLLCDRLRLLSHFSNNNVYIYAIMINCVCVFFSSFHSGRCRIRCVAGKRAWKHILEATHFFSARGLRVLGLQLARNGLFRCSRGDRLFV